MQEQATDRCCGLEQGEHQRADHDRGSPSADDGVQQEQRAGRRSPTAAGASTRLADRRQRDRPGEQAPAEQERDDRRRGPRPTSSTNARKYDHQPETGRDQRELGDRPGAARSARSGRRHGPSGRGRPRRASALPVISLPPPEGRDRLARVRPSTAVCPPVAPARSDPARLTERRRGRFPPAAPPRPPLQDATISRISAAVSLGVFPTRTPAASSASFLACAVPAEPDTIAPAWPMVLPSGAVNPAT